MALEDIQDQIREQFSSLVSKIQESATYNGLRERYETLTPNAQRGIVLGSISLVIILLVSIPFSYFASSSLQNEAYNSNRSLLRGLLRASRLASDVSNVPSFATLQSIKTNITNELTAMGLQAEQLGGVIELPEAALGANLAPASITQSGLGINLKKLNLNQIIDIGFKLQALHPAVKLSGLEITANKPDPHYFDVDYKVAVFGQVGGGNTADSQATSGEDEVDDEPESVVTPEPKPAKPPVKKPK